MRKAAMLGLVGCAGSAAVIGWIAYLLLQLVVMMQTPCLAAWFGGKDADHMLLGEVNELLSFGLSPAALLTFGYCLCVYTALAVATPLVEGSISVHRKFP